MDVIIPLGKRMCVCVWGGGGGGGIFYKSSLPLKIRNDLSFDECIVTELKFGHKKIFFTVLYRQPSHRADNEFANFIANFDTLVSSIRLENPYLLVFAGVFNAQSESWWIDGDTNNEGLKLANTFSDLDMTQLISEPTHFRDNCNPTCIDLILTDQPNPITSCGVRPSLLDPYSKHQITFCNLNMTMAIMTRKGLTNLGMNVSWQ